MLEAMFSLQISSLDICMINQVIFPFFLGEFASSEAAYQFQTPIRDQWIRLASILAPNDYDNV